MAEKAAGGPRHPLRFRTHRSGSATDVGGAGLPRSRTQLRPTVFGVVVAVLLLVAGLLRPSVADPSVTGLVWAGLLGALLLGVIWPAIAVRMVKVRIVAAPQDLVVGQLSSLELELTTRASGLSIGCTGSGTSVVDAVSPGVVRIPVSISARGAYRWIRIDVGSDAPFGIVWANRTRLVALPRQLLVGPESRREHVPLVDLPGDLHDPSPTGQGPNGEAVRSVRPYVTGDPSHLVHWPSTARVGSLVVRELEPPATRGIAVVVDLTPVPASRNPSRNRSDGTHSETDFGVGEVGETDVRSGDPVEAAASRAAGIAEVALDDGARVMLCTVESAGPVVAEVADLLDVRRRLALAVGGTPSSPPDDWPVIRVAATSSVATGAPSSPRPRNPSPTRNDHPETETDFGGGASPSSPRPRNPSPTRSDHPETETDFGGGASSPPPRSGIPSPTRSGHPETETDFGGAGSVGES